MSGDCDVIVIFLIYGQNRAIHKPDSWRTDCKTYISIKVTFYLGKTENKTKKSPTQLTHYCFE